VSNKKIFIYFLKCHCLMHRTSMVIIDESRRLQELSATRLLN